MRAKEFIVEASYDGMISNLRNNYPEQTNFINQHITWAKTILKKDERIVWYLRLVGAELKSPTNQLNNIQEQLEHFKGMNIPAFDSIQFGKKSPDEVFAELRTAERAYQAKLDKSKPTVTPQQGDYEIIKFNDGSAWWFVDRAYCEQEGKSGAHCGNIMGRYNPDQRILSYRVDNRVKMTFILEPDGRLGEMKGWGNQKPQERYHSHIVTLLLSDIVKGIQGGGYLPDMNFSIFDLNDQLLTKLNDQKPQLVSDQISLGGGEVLKAPPKIRLQYLEKIQRRSPGILELIDPKTGEYSDDEKKWLEAVRITRDLALIVPESIINEFNDIIVKILVEEPRKLLTTASDPVRKNWSVLSKFVTWTPEGISVIQPSTPRYEDLVLLAARNHGTEIAQYIPTEYQTDKFFYAMNIGSYYAMDVTPDRLKTPKFYQMIASVHQNVLQYIPVASRTKKVCTIAVKKYPWSIRHVPKEFITKELVTSAVSRAGSVIFEVPEEFRTQELYILAVKSSPSIIEQVPRAYRVPEMNDWVAQSHEGLRSIPEDQRTFRVCKLAVDYQPRQIGLVPLENVSEEEYLELCRSAIKRDKWSITKVDPDYQDQLKKEFNIDD